MIDGLHGEIESHEFASWNDKSLPFVRMHLSNFTHIGRSPASAEPTARPANPISVIGVSTTRFSPNLSKRPLVTCSWSKSLAVQYPKRTDFVCTIVLRNFFP